MGHRGSIRIGAVLAAGALVAAAAGLAGSASSAGAAATGEWPMYGADLANSRTVAGGPSAASAAKLHEVWRIDATDGDFTGTPVVSGGVAYVGSNGGVLRAIQAVAAPGHAPGSIVWSRSVAPDPVNGSLAVADGLVYVPVAKQGGPYVLALDAATGETRWSTVLDTSPAADVYASPVIAPDRSGRPLVLEGVSAVVGDPDTPLRGSVTALDAATGAVVWKSYMVPEGFNGAPVWSSPAVDTARGRVYVGTGNAYSGTAAPTTDSIVALDVDTGAILGSYQALANDVFSGDGNLGLDFDFGSSPNLFTVGGRDLVGEGQKSGTYWALDRTTMTPVWHTQIGPGTMLGGIIGSTAYDAASHRLVGPISLPGYVWSLHADSGLPAWVGAGVADPAHVSPVAISNGVVWSVVSSGFLGAWSESTGLLLKQVPLDVGTVSFGGVAVADGLVIANSGGEGTSGSIVAFSAG